MEPRPLSLKERIFVQIGVLYSKRMFGNAEQSFIEELIRTFGVNGFFEWGKQTDRVKGVMSQRWDDFTGELLLGFGAMWNGCTYCSRTHTAAANCYYFKDKGELFPISEDDIIDLQRMSDEDAMARIEELLKDEKYAETRSILRRQYEMKRMVRTPENRDDEIIDMANAAWDWATECSIVVSRDPVPPISPIGKDKALVARYRAARGGDYKLAGPLARAGVTR